MKLLGKPGKNCARDRRLGSRRKRRDIQDGKRHTQLCRKLKIEKASRAATGACRRINDLRLCDLLLEISSNLQKF